LSKHVSIRLLGALIASSCFTLIIDLAEAVAPKRISLSSTVWSDLGTGSMMCQAHGQPVSVSMADVQPDANDAGFMIAGGATPITLIPSNAAAHIWAKAAATNSAGVIACESFGNSTLNPSIVSQAGSTGSDASANAINIPMAGLSLIQTVAVNPSRLSIEIQNQSAGLIQIVRDDGAGNNQTSILLASGGSAGSQGGSWSSLSFKGRLRIYGVSGAQVAAYQD